MKKHVIVIAALFLLVIVVGLYRNYEGEQKEPSFCYTFTQEIISVTQVDADRGVERARTIINMIPAVYTTENKKFNMAGFRRFMAEDRQKAEEVFKLMYDYAYEKKNFKFDKEQFVGAEACVSQVESWLPELESSD